MTQILFVSLLLPGSWVFGQTNAKEFTPPDESPALTARMDVTAHEQSFTVRFSSKTREIATPRWCMGEAAWA
jgi:hypothetical protein